MMGNCLGWVAYSVLTNDLFVFVSNAPGLLLSVWLNMGAAKLQYQEFFYMHEHNQLSNTIHTEEVEEEEMIDLPPFTPHEKWVMRVVFTWIVVLSYVCFYPMNNIQQTHVVGLVVNFNLVVFYGAPLSTIAKVLKTRNSRSIHRRTMSMGLLNSFFWMCYGIALTDIVIFFPNFCGFVLSLVQFVLCLLYKRDVVTVREEHESNDPQQLQDGNIENNVFEEINEETREML
jgi:solute carrier family 50 (sugar transporter)